MTRVLLIEDDPVLGPQVAEQLRAEGFTTQLETSGRPLQPGELRALDLVILDLSLPGLFGLDVLKQLREHSDVPVLVLSARDTTPEKVRALKLGADDYLTKPFWPEELSARVHARIRRPTLKRGDCFTIGALTLDQARRTVVVDGQALDLTPLEFALVCALALRAGEAVTRRWLVDNLFPEDSSSNHALDVHVSRVRKKLGEGVRISTVWGVGYRLERR